LFVQFEERPDPKMALWSSARRSSGREALNTARHADVSPRHWRGDDLLEGASRLRLALAAAGNLKTAKKKIVNGLKDGR